MNVLFDTNVVLDVMLDRAPYSEPAAYLMTRVEAGEIVGFLGATTITTIFYLSHKALGKDRAQKEVAKLLSIFDIAPVNRPVLAAAMQSGFNDFEDAVLHEAARHAGIKSIVTRDVSGFKHSKIPVYSPEELIKMLVALKQE